MLTFYSNIKKNSSNIFIVYSIKINLLKIRLLILFIQIFKLFIANQIK